MNIWMAVEIEGGLIAYVVSLIPTALMIQVKPTMSNAIPAPKQNWARR